jgi:hypothetical protein
MHVVCSIFYRNGSAPLLVRSWDNHFYPQHREGPFYDMLATIMMRPEHRQKLARNHLPVCFVIQDSLDDALQTLRVSSDGQWAGDTAVSSAGGLRPVELQDAVLLANLERSGTITVCVPDHTFSLWRAAKSLPPFDSFYADVLYRTTALAAKLDFKDRRRARDRWQGPHPPCGGPAPADSEV